MRVLRVVKTPREKKSAQTFQNRVAPGSEVTDALSFPYRVGERQETVFLAGETRCRPDYDCYFEDPSHACLMYAAGGSGEFLLEGKRYTLAPGDMILLRPGTPWRFRTDGENPWHLFWLNFHSHLLLEMIAFYRIPTVLLHDGGLTSHFLSLIATVREKDSSFAERRDRALGQALRLLQEIDSLLSDRQNNSPGARDALRVADHINTHIMEDIRVSALAKLVFRSTYSLSLVFKERYGCTPKEYILRAKCEVAARLLSENNRSVSEIADMLSFCDAQHFSQVFRRRYGMSPSVYRMSASGKK